MKTITAEHAENEAARNWCAGILAGAGSQIEGDVAKRYVDIGVGILLSNYKDEEMSDEEKQRRCAVIYARARGKDPHRAYVPCVVDGATYITCKDCPLARVPP